MGDYALDEGKRVTSRGGEKRDGFPLGKGGRREQNPSVSGIEELASTAHPRDGHRKIFAMIEAYLDESGIHEGAKICVIAGYFAPAQQWKKFELAWRKLLNDNLVKAENFHANTLFKKTGSFFSWSRRNQQAFVKKVLEIIRNHKIYPISSGVIVEDFNLFSSEERQYLTGATYRHDTGKLFGGCPTKPYFVPFQMCVRKIALYAPAHGRAHFVFGLDKTFSKYALELFLDMKVKAPISWRDKLGNPSSPLATETPGLQAADVLVYLTYLHMTRNFSPGKGWTVTPKDELGFLLQNAKSASDFTCFDKVYLQGMLDELKAEVAKVLSELQG